MAKYAGAVLESLGSYTPIFLFCGVAYLLALLVVHLINPKWAPVTSLDQGPDSNHSIAGAKSVP